MHHRLWLAAATAALALYPIAATAADTIKIGFPIPEKSVEHWLQAEGEIVAEEQGLEQEIALESEGAV